MKTHQMEVSIRQEIETDINQVELVIKSAFKLVQISDQTEHLLVNRIRGSSSFIPDLSLVAVVDNKLVGHILLSKILIKNEQQTFDSLALAPVSVHPGFQKQNIGSTLILSAHKIAKVLGFSSVILIGHEDYYPRFGYQPCSKFNIKMPFDVPDKNAMAIELKKNGLKNVSGIVQYPDIFFE